MGIFAEGLAQAFKDLENGVDNKTSRLAKKMVSTGCIGIQINGETVYDKGEKEKHK